MSSLKYIHPYISLPFLAMRLVAACFTDDDDGCSVDCDMGSTSSDGTYEYELIGVTVHTGTADGGHYYSFIRDRLNKSESGQDKWYVTC